MTTTRKYQRITKKHVGRPCEILGYNAAEGIEQHGRIEEVKNGYAVIRVHVITEQDGRRIHSEEGFRFLTPVSCEKSRVVTIW